MRIISGKYKKTNLFIPKKINFRPTSDFIKEAVFSSIQFFIKDSIFLDLFCGSGNIGLEALSRGAKKVFFVDNSSNSIKILKKNLNILNIPVEHYKIIYKDFDRAIKYFHSNNTFFNIIYADPPYNRNFIKIILKLIENYKIMMKDGLLIIEHSKKEIFNMTSKNLELYKMLDYGDKKITILKRR